jgi:hypothetical protein
MRSRENLVSTQPADLIANPLRQFLKLRVCDYPNPTRQRGIEFLRFDSISKNPSLTRRVMIIPCVFDSLIYPCLEHRNFKMRQRGIVVENTATFIPH